MNGTQPLSKCNPSRRPVLLLAGEFNWQHVDVAALARGFNWDVQEASEFLPDSTDGDVRAVFCHVEGNDIQPIEESRRLYPRARIVACSRFRCPVDWDRMEASGAFHHLHLPFDEHEVNVCLGFLATAMAKEPPSIALAPQPPRQILPSRETLRALPFRRRAHLRWRLRPA